MDRVGHDHTQGSQYWGEQHRGRGKRRGWRRAAGCNCRRKSGEGTQAAASVNKSLTIFYPSPGVGGSQLAFARMGRELSKRHGWDITLVDLPDGFVGRQMRESGVPFRFVEYVPGGKPIDVGETTLLLSFSGLPHDLACLSAAPTTRVLLWSLHAQGALSFLRFGFLYRRLRAPRRETLARLLEPGRWGRTRQLLAEMEKLGSLVYMDKTNSDYPPSVGFGPTHTQFLPIPVEHKAAHPRTWTETRSLGWVGRLVHDKAHTIEAFIALCSRHATQYGITFDFHVVGDGPALERLKNFTSPGVVKHFPGVLRGDRLDSYLCDHIKVGFAMGTSLLEFAMLGIPVLVGDYSNERFPIEKLPLRWLVPNDGFALGEIIGERPRAASVTFFEITEHCTDEQSNFARGAECRAYAVAHHDAASVADLLDRLLRGARFSFETARLSAGGGEPALGPRLKAGLERLMPRKMKSS